MFYISENATRAQGRFFIRSAHVVEDLATLSSRSHTMSVGKNC